MQRQDRVESAVVPRAGPQDQLDHGHLLARTQDDRPQLVQVKVLALLLAAAAATTALAHGDAVDDDGHGKVVLDADLALELAALALGLARRDAGRAAPVVVDVGQEEVGALLVEEQRAREDARAVRHRHLELAVLGLDHDLAGVDALGTD